MSSSCLLSFVMIVVTMIPVVVNGQGDASSVNDENLQVVWQYYRHAVYRDGGSVRIGLQNTGSESITIESVRLGDKKLQVATESNRVQATKIWQEQGAEYIPSHVKAGDVMWWWMTGEEMSPQESAELIVKFYKPPTDTVRINVTTEAGDEIEVFVEPEIAPLAISSVTFTKDLRTVYVYVLNQSDTPFELVRTWLDGVERTKDCRFIGAVVEPGSKGCVLLKMNDALPQGRRISLRVETKAGQSMGTTVRAFSSFPIVARGRGVIQSPARFDEDGFNTAKQHTKDPYYKLDVVGHEIISNLRNPSYLRPDQLMYLWSNQGFIKTGAWAFGELVDGAQVHLQPLSAEYLGPYNNRDFHYVQAKMRFLRECLRPNPIFAQTEVGHGMMSANYQSLLTPEEMRLRLYYLMSRGAKGLLYRSGGSKLAEKSTPEQRKALEDEIVALSDELFAMKPYLRIGEFVDGMARTSEPLVEAAALLCGDQGITVVLLNHDRQTAWPKEEMYMGNSFWVAPKPDPIRVTVDIPKPMIPDRIYVIDRSLVFTTPFEFEDGSVQFDVAGISTTCQYVIAFKGGAVSDDWFMTLPTRPVKRIDGPDVQFERKQWSWGELPPGDEPVKHRFVVRNVGKTGALTLTPKRVEGHVKVHVPSKPIPPGESDVVVLSARRTSPRDHHIAWLTTNDVNEPEVRLEMGGLVREPYRVVPDRIRLTKYLDGRVRASNMMVRVIDQGAGDLKLDSIEASSDHIRFIRHAPEKRTMTLAHAEVYRPEHVEVDHPLELAANLTNRNESGREWLTIHTNATWQSVIRVPIDIEVESAVEVSPRRLFFGVVSGPASRQLTLKSSLGLVKVVSTKADHEGIEVKTTSSADQTTLQVRIGDALKAGKVKGELHVSVEIGKRREKLIIPYFAMSRHR